MYRSRAVKRKRSVSTRRVSRARPLKRVKRAVRRAPAYRRIARKRVSTASASKRNHLLYARRSRPHGFRSLPLPRRSSYRSSYQSSYVPKSLSDVAAETAVRGAASSVGRQGAWYAGKGLKYAFKKAYDYAAPAVLAGMAGLGGSNNLLAGLGLLTAASSVAPMYHNAPYRNFDHPGFQEFRPDEAAAEEDDWNLADFV